MQDEPHAGNETPRIKVVRRNDAYVDREGKHKKKSAIPLWLIVAIAAAAYFWHSKSNACRDNGGSDGVLRRPPSVETPPARTPPVQEPPVQAPRVPQPQQGGPQVCSTCGGKRIVRIPCPCPSCSELSLNNVVLTKHGGMCGVCGGQGGAVAPNGFGMVCPNCSGLGFAVCDKCSGAGEVLVRCPSCSDARSSSAYASNMNEENISCRVSEKLKTKKRIKE